MNCVDLDRMCLSAVLTNYANHIFSSSEVQQQFWEDDDTIWDIYI